MVKDIQIKYKNEQKEWEELYPKTKTRNITNDKGESQEEINENLTTQLADNTQQINDLAVNVKNFGAKGDGVTDDTQAIQNAINYCYENNLVVYGIGEYLITSPIRITCETNLKNALFIYDGEDVALKVGFDESQTRVKNLQLPKIKKKNRRWYENKNLNDIGIELINLYECQILVPKISDFSIGLKLVGLDDGVVYNNITIGHLENNRINLLTSNDNTSGWVNENLFIGGRFSHLVNQTNIEIPEISHIVLRNANNNLFLKPSIEGLAPYYTLDIRGSYNTFLQARYEGYENLTQYKKRVIFRASERVYGAQYNILAYGYNLEHVEITQEGNARNNSVFSSKGSVDFSDSSTGARVIQNYGGRSSPALRILGTDQDPYSLDYVFKVSQNYVDMKAYNDDYPRIRISNPLGRIYFGSGLDDPLVSLRHTSGGLKVEDGNLYIGDGTFDSSHLRLGNYHIWVDVNGKLRINDGGPTHDLAGEVVGTQS